MYFKNSIFKFSALALGLSLTFFSSCTSEDPVVVGITTSAVIDIEGTRAVGGGNITTDIEFNRKGVVYGKTPNPTREDDNDNYVGASGIGAFTTNLVGLDPTTTYYVRAYVTTDDGVTYGDQVTFTTTMAIGASYQGGKIAYLFKAGDAGYVAGENHGLIAAPSDQSTGAAWGCSGTSISGATGTAIGTGSQNTTAIATQCGENGIAAKLCYDLVLGGYSDWYLPSIEELEELDANMDEIGGFPAGGARYISSSQYNSSNAYGMFVSPSTTIFSQNDYGKSATYRVRAVRTF